MSKKIKKTLKIISDVLVIAVVLFVFLLHGTKLIGLTPYTVLSGSMESVYPTGSLIYVTKVDPEELEVGEIITFRLQNGSVATHRIIELVTDERDPSTTRFRTKGDENNVADGSLVDFGSVIGKPIFCIPFLGYLASYISVAPGKFVALCVAISLIAVEILISIILDESGKKDSGKPES